MKRVKLLRTMLVTAVVMLMMTAALQIAFASGITVTYESKNEMDTAFLSDFRYTWKPMFTYGDVLTVTENGVDTRYVYDSGTYKGITGVKGFYDDYGVPLAEKFRCKINGYGDEIYSFYPFFEWIDEPTTSGKYASYSFLLYDLNSPDDAAPVAKTDQVKLYIEPVGDIDGVRYRVNKDGTARADAFIDFDRTEFTIQATVTLDDGKEYQVKSIEASVAAAGSFLGSENIESISIPEGITTIGKAAFLGTTGLKEVTIPSSVKEIGKFAFGYNGTYSFFSDGMEVYGKIPDFVIYAEAGSEGARYAKENGIKWIDLKAQEKDAAADAAYAKAKAAAAAIAEKTLAKARIKNIKAGKKKMTVKWKKISNATGYEIRYSSDKNFKIGVKSRTVKTFKKKGLTINKLKKKKIWYVQIRAYTTVCGETYYGPWSAKKRVKVK
jgi:hypothetical protein